MADHVVKGTVEWEGRRITVEGPPEFVSSELDRFRNVTPHAAQPSATVEPADATQDARSRPVTDATFVQLKKPKGHSEIVAVLAVRLREAGQAEFTEDEMRRAYLRAGIKPPKVMSQALIDAKRFKDYVEPTETRGRYKLTNFGSDFVQFDLPRSESKK